MGLSMCYAIRKSQQIWEAMKTIILVGLLAVFSGSASAQRDMHACALRSSMYESVATWRNSDVAPESALRFSVSYKEIPVEDRKRIINIVYFDPAFENAGGEALRNQMLDLCLNGPKDWKPLK
ncbi:MAG: hypothetical protein JWP38_3750 [Herbaspirillum sp.]|nr:hypothetical protein [Herbaspirillum sp.]